MKHQIRPLTEEVRARMVGSPAPIYSRFTRGTDSYRRESIPWTATLEVLNREVKALGSDEFILMLDVSESQVRIDGQIRADARPASHIAAVSFESKRGPLLFVCGRFRDWKDNVRAIALGLEALRKVDRYGITQSDEQYTGFRALPPAGRFSTASEAARFLARAAGMDELDEELVLIINDPDELARAYRRAARNYHPDAGGDAEKFHRLTAARDFLEAMQP